MFIQLCGWIGTHKLFPGAMSDTIQLKAAIILSPVAVVDLALIIIIIFIVLVKKTTIQSSKCCLLQQMPAMSWSSSPSLQWLTVNLPLLLPPPPPFFFSGEVLQREA